MPFSGISVRIVNMDFEPDLVDYQNNDSAFVASAMTDANGL